MATENPIIETRALTRRFGKQLAVDTLNLFVPAGGVYGYLGPNGAGKTTAIRMLLGLIRPNAGEVRLFGQPLQANRYSLMQQVGALVETPSLYPHLTGRENLEVPNSKTGRDYTVPMNEDVRRTLQQIRRTTRGGGHVFINPDTAKPYTDIKTAFGTACQLAGIENLHWHDLRHTFGTRLAEAGCSEATIADLMGHFDPQTTRRYTHATDRAKRAAVEAVRLKLCHNPATKQWGEPLG